MRQGAHLELRDSALENNGRMGVSALGSDTMALLEGNVVTGSGEHGVAQGQGAQVYVAHNTVKDNKIKDIFGNVHDSGAAGDKRRAHGALAGAGAGAASETGGDSQTARAVQPARSREDTPLLRGQQGPRQSRRRIKLAVLALVSAAAVVLSALYVYLSYAHVGVKAW